jgi:pantoate--beta-alanine ligase
VHTRSELRAAVGNRPGEVGVVMSLGALHDGHRELIRTARRSCDVVLVTVFLNPLQFGPNEDLTRYPRTLEADVELCAAEGVDVVFAPGVDEVYPNGRPQVLVHAGPLGDVLEGASRPGHFDGVLTVVAKLLHMTAPDVTFFGAKDAQQVLLVRRMVDDLDFPVQVVTVPTVRDPDGLALSSRNTYLEEADRRAALVLSRALRAGSEVSGAGATAVRDAARSTLASEPAVAVDYLALVDPATLAEVADDYTGQALLAVAAKVGRTRLIDNVSLHVGPAEEAA